MNYNLFSMFDPLNKYMSLNYMFFNFLLIINLNYWLMKNLNIMNKILLFESKNKSNYLLMKMIFLMILNMNMINIMPYMYSNSIHITFTLNFTLNLWLMMIIFSLKNNMNIFFMNLSPNKTSMNLIMIINLIEFNSMIFSIMSISMRLMINMMMGHLIFYMLSIKMMIYLYMLIELLIIMIQSYIFITLNLINLNNMN